MIGPSKRIILLTSAFHKYRAKKLFEKQGFKVLSYKVSSDLNITFMDFLPSTANLESSEIGIKEIIGRIYYIIKG